MMSRMGALGSEDMLAMLVGLLAFSDSVSLTDGVMEMTSSASTRLVSICSSSELVVGHLRLIAIVGKMDRYVITRLPCAVFPLP
jgi:hypothetical protein